MNESDVTEQRRVIPASTELALPSDLALPADMQVSDMPIAVRLYFDDRLYQRIEAMAVRMAKSEIIIPSHLRGKPDACFAVVVYSLTWKLNPYAVAAATYQPVEGGKIGFEGKLVQAIIEQSGRLEGGLEYEHYGDWSQVQGRFKMVQPEGKKKYAQATWSDDDARSGGCGVIVRAQIRGEKKPRELHFDLIQAQPRNSTLWSTDPKTQIQYTACRRFGNTVVPGLLMGVPFEPEDNYTPAGEREVEAEVVERQPIRMPKSKPVDANADVVGNQTDSVVVDHTTGEVKRQTAEQREPVKRDTSSPPASDGQKNLIRAKLEQGSISDSEMFKAIGIDAWDAMSVEDGNEALKFLKGPADYARA